MSYISDFIARAIAARSAIAGIDWSGVKTPGQWSEQLRAHIGSNAFWNQPRAQFGSVYSGSEVPYEIHGTPLPSTKAVPSSSSRGYIQRLFAEHPEAFYGYEHKTTGFERLGAWVAGFAAAYTLGAIGGAVWGAQAAAGVRFGIRVATAAAISVAGTAVAKAGVNPRLQSAFFSGGGWGAGTYAATTTAAWFWGKAKGLVGTPFSIDTAETIMYTPMIGSW